MTERKTRNYIGTESLQKKLDGVSRSTINRLVQKRYLPAPVKMAGMLYWDEDEVDDRMDANKQAQRADDAA